MSENEAKANAIVNTYRNWSAVAGLVPVPVVDIAAVAAIQVKMLHSVSKVYGIPFAEHRVKAVVGSMLGGVLTPVGADVALGLLGPVLKFIPVIGPVLGMLVMPAVAAAATVAVGRTFIQHFETGGTLLDLDAAKLKEHFRQAFDAERAAKAGPSTDTAKALGKAAPAG